MLKEKVAIIMPVYNAEKTIERAINSILSQEYKNWTLYIINDCSTDASRDIISPFLKDERIKYIENQENVGVSGTRNIGLSLSNELVISFLDSDDAWHEKKLVSQLELLKKNDIVISNYSYIQNNVINEIIYDTSHINIRDFLKKKYRVCFSSLIYRKKKDIKFKKIGHEDFLFIYDLIKSLGNISVSSKCLVNYYETSGSVSSNKRKAAIWHLLILKKIFNNNIVFISYYFFYYVLNGLLFRKKLKRTHE